MPGNQGSGKVLWKKIHGIFGPQTIRKYEHKS